MAKKKPPKESRKFPPNAVVSRMREKLSDPSYRGGNLALPVDATEVDRLKYELCQLIARYQRENSLKQKQIAEMLGIDESRISDILRGKLEGFTLDRLIGYAKILHPELKLTIEAA